MPHLEFIKKSFYNASSISDLSDLINFVYTNVYSKSRKKIDLTPELLKHIVFYNQENNYSKFKIPKKNKIHYRTIHSPSLILKKIQKSLKIIFEILLDTTDKDIAIHSNAYGFRKNFSIVDNAKPHIGCKFIYNIDLRNFFSNTTSDHLRSTLKLSPFKLNSEHKDITDIIIGICCHQGSLPQGSPLSPLLTNLVFYKIDTIINELCKENKIIYTRYADDLTFSSHNNNITKDFKNKIKQILNNHNYTINTRKERNQFYGKRLEVTGIVINEKVNLKRSFIKDLDFWLKKWSSDELIYKTTSIFKKKEFYKNDKKKKDIKKILLGRIHFLGMVRGKNDVIYQKFMERWHQGLLKHSVISSVANFLYEARPIKSFGSTDPVAAMKQFKNSHSDWVFPEISDKPTRKEVRKWFEIVYKQQQIFFLNRLKMQYPQTWLQELVKNIEVTKEVGGTTATFGNVQVNGDVDRYSININKEFVKQITGKNFSNTFPFVLHSIKGKGGVVLKSNGKSLTELTFEELVENGLSGTIHTNEEWIEFKQQHAKMIEALDTVVDGVPFSKVLTLNHEIYGKPYSEATYQQVEKENVYLTYEHNGNQYYILVDNPDDGFSEASGVYILDSNFKRINLGSKGIAIEAEIFEEIARANTNPKSPLNFRGKNLVSKRRITTSKGIEDRIHTNHIVGKTYTDVEALKQFLDSTIQDTSKEYTTEETVPDIYITIDNYKSDGQLRLDVTKSKGNKYQFSVKLSSVTGGNQTGTLNFSIDKTNKDILGTIIRLIKSQGIKNQKLTGFTEDTKVQLTQKAPEWTDESIVFTSVINSLPLEYEVDRWIPVPLTQEVTDLVVGQKTELPLDSTNLEDLMVISNFDIGEIPTEEELDIPEQKTIEEVVFDLVKDKNNLLMVDNVFYTGIKNMKEFLNNPKWYDKWLNDILSENKENVVKAKIQFGLTVDKKRVNTKFLIPLDSPTTRTIEEIVFDLVKDKNDLLMIDYVFYTGIKDMREFFNNPKWYDKWLSYLQGSPEDVIKAKKTFWNIVSKKEINTKFLIPLDSPTTRV